jgi:nickel superoxide dismutase
VATVPAACGVVALDPALAARATHQALHREELLLGVIYHDDVAHASTPRARRDPPLPRAERGSHGVPGHGDPEERHRGHGGILPDHEVPGTPGRTRVRLSGALGAELSALRAPDGGMMLTRITAWLAPRTTVHAHCDLPCGVYDPAQAKIEAQSVKACMEKYHASDDPDFKARAISIKEERSNLVKEHLWILWTDYFKPPHFEKYPNLNQLFNEATKLAGAGGTKGTVDVAVADQLLGKIDEISEIFWETKKA